MKEEEQKRALTELKYKALQSEFKKDFVEVTAASLTALQVPSQEYLEQQ